MSRWTTLNHCPGEPMHGNDGWETTLTGKGIGIELQNFCSEMLPGEPKKQFGLNFFSKKHTGYQET